MHPYFCNMNKKTGYFFLCLAAAFAFGSCREIVAPEYVDVENVEINAGSLTNTTLSANVKLYNPNKSNLTFKSGSLDIYVDNRLLGHTELDTTIHIARLDTFHIPVQVHVKDSILLRLEGKMRVGRSGVFITRPVFYENKEKLQLF